MHLGHHAKADGRWRIYAFADAPAVGEPSLLSDWAAWMTSSPESPLLKYTPADGDSDAVFDVKLVAQQDFEGVPLGSVPSLFLPLLVFGAAYMIWIGIGLMRSAIVVNGDEAQASASVRKAFWRAVLTCLSNPKAYLFMMAIYPQFLKPAYGPIWM